MVIEKIRHACRLEGCKEMVRQKECSYRLVICPGSNLTCKAMLPFAEVEKHLATCSDVEPWSKAEGKTHEVFDFPEDRLNSRIVPYNTNLINFNGQIFFLRAKKQ